MEWQRDGGENRRERKRISEIGVWLIVGFCTGMRGEEMVLIELAGTQISLEHMNENEGYFKVVISGRTKDNQFSGSKLSFPISSFFNLLSIFYALEVENVLFCLSTSPILMLLRI